MTFKVSHVLTFVLTVLVCSPVRADSRVAVQEFRGRHADDVRDEVARVLSLQKDVTVVPQREVSARARSLGADLRTPAGRLAVARDLQLAAWIAGTVKKRHHKLKVSIEVHDAAANTRIGRVSLSERGVREIKAALREDLWDRSRDAVQLATAPLPDGRAPMEGAAPGDGDANEAPAEDDAGETRVASAKTVSSATRSTTLAHDDSALMSAPRRKDRDTLRAAVGVGSPFRSLAYSDPITQSLGDYRLGGALMVDLGAVYYPGRHFTDGWASWLGLDVATQLARGSRTDDALGNAFESRYSAFRLGLRGRVPVGKHAVSVFSGYAVNKVSIAAVEGDVSSPTPNVDYRILRSGVGTELALGRRLGLGIDASYLHILSVGQLGEWFPRATARGVELALSASYAITNYLFARVAGTYARSAFDFKSQPGDAFAAGGATDQFLTASMGMGVNL
ncbi:MAG: hypothetical protein ABW252_21255 [Polyangiales bacterium]